MFLQCPVCSAPPAWPLVQSWFPWPCMIWRFHKLAARQLQLALFSLQWLDAFAAGETLTRAWNSPGRNSKAASWTLRALSHLLLSHPRHPHHTWPVRWNVEMKWYALIKNELTQHAANADVDVYAYADAAADVALFCGHCLGWFRFHCSSSLSPCPFALPLSFGLCNWYCLIFMFLLRYCALLLLLLLFFITLSNQ